ncbi:MAG: hypothetical protein KJO00_10090 [Bacteroidia bacterium]|nr:hypothetical protein [Bacteroidia bacterium]
MEQFSHLITVPIFRERRYTNQSLAVVLIVMLFSVLSGWGQSFFEGDYVISTNQIEDQQYGLFEFCIGESNCKSIKTAFFADQPYKKLKELQSQKKVLLATSASFASAVMVDGKPIGFCADNGQILNKMPNQVMDGIVVVNSHNESMDKMIVYDLDMPRINCDENCCGYAYMHYNPREEPYDVFKFFSWIDENKLSAFQTQLVYSRHNSDPSRFEQPYHGKNDRSRRFLGVVKKNENLRHIIIDIPKNDYLMHAAGEALDLLSDRGYEVEYLLNLDTGSKDILHAFNGENLVNLRPGAMIKAGTIERANNLLVYYLED